MGAADGNGWAPIFAKGELEIVPARVTDGERRFFKPRAWLNATETGRTEAFDALGRQLEQARARHEGAKALDEALFGQDFEAA
jgi:hypothetical protein